MTKPFLILQLRPEDFASDDEFNAMINRGKIDPSRVHRVRLDEAPLGEVNLDDYAGVVIGGGPGCVSDKPEEKDPLEDRMEKDALRLMPEIVARDMPFLGCCLGLGILAKHLGGDVAKGRYAEPVGGTDCRLTEAGRADPLLDGLPEEFQVLVGHKESVQETPPGAVNLVEGVACPIQMIRVKSNVYATQFHPESNGDTFAGRVDAYKHRGYFPPEEAEALKARLLALDITVPNRILQRFFSHYG